MKKLNILVCNDDGVLSIGAKILIETLRTFANVTYVLPDSEKSAISHAVTLNSSLRIHKLEENGYVCNGTPADCTRIGLWKKNNIDIVISGINPGPNLANDVWYSGTVAGAREAIMCGTNAISVSLMGNNEQGFIQASLAVKNILEKHYNALFKNTPSFYNVNIPIKKINGIKITCLGHRRYGKDFIPRKDPRGKIYYWTDSRVYSQSVDTKTDVGAIEQGYISITPLTIDVLNTKVYKDLKELKITI